MTAPRPHPRDEPGVRDEPGAHDDGWSWREVAPWVLALSTALPVLFTVETVRRVLTGTLDQFTLGFNAEGGDDGPGYAARWALLQQFSDVQSGLLAAGVGAALLAAVALSGRPDWLVPQGPARWAALATTAVSALTGLGMVVAVLVRWSLGPGEPQYFARTDLFVSLGPVSGVALFTLGVSTLSTIALWRSGDHRPDGPAGDPEAVTEPVAADPPPGPVAPPEPPEQPAPGPVATAGPPALPRDHEEFYRRPRA